MRQLGAVLVAVLLAGWVLTGSAFAQVSSIETDIVHIFGETIHFSAKVKSSIPVKAGVLFFRAVGDTRTTVGLADVENLGPNRYLLTYLHEIADYPLRPFSTIQYHWELTLANGEVVSSPEQIHVYTDNRFDWNTLGDGQFRVHWYKGELAFAQRVLDIAHEGKEQINNLLTIPLPEAVPVDIYIYEENESLQSALQTKAEEWVAGHADPDLGVVLMALPESPERQLLAEQRIPHELMHIFLYNSTPLGYKNIPVWLTEGLASLAELYSNPDYPIVLEEAVKAEGLLPMSALCGGFPRESSGALLAYAQAQDFTQHLKDSFGRSGIMALILAYSNGLDCDHGAQQALGKNLKQLERTWVDENLSQDFKQNSLDSLVPWLIILLAVFAVPLGLGLRRINASRANRHRD